MLVKLLSGFFYRVTIPELGLRFQRSGFVNFRLDVLIYTVFCVGTARPRRSAAVKRFARCVLIFALL